MLSIRRPTRWMLTAAAMLLGAPLAAGSAQEQAEPERQPIRVEVENHNFLDMKVYVVSHGRSWRLGTVTGLTDETLTLPAWLNGTADPIQLLAVPIGARAAASTFELLVRPGDVVVFDVAPRLALSNAWVRSGP